MKAKKPYPALLWLQGKKACVIGGGRKLEYLSHYP